MPTYERYKGLKFFCYSHEEMRAHVHVMDQAGRVAKFWLEPEIALYDDGGLNARDLRIASTRIEEKREEYLKRWEEHFE